ncbi:MAG: DUF5668 domain-containing protein [Anaerolineae bacterium]|jgi:hypothetical protein|nr:DUF5668 domain-containing protein [Anaerolineae bacterium]
MEEKRHYRGGFVWPVMLIGAGVVFLLNNLGLVSWDVWGTLLRLWPVLLIAIGLDLLVGRRFPLGSVLLAGLLVVVLALAVQGALPVAVNASTSANVDRTETVSQSVDGVARATVDIDFGSGELNLSALSSDSGQLIEGAADLSRGETLRQEYRKNGDAGYFTLESAGSWSSGPDFFLNQEKSWDLGLNRDLPLDLVVNAGAGKSMLDLVNLNLRRLQLDSGVGQVTVKLPETGKYNVRINGGVGQTIVMAPEGLAARIQVDGGLGGVSAQGDFTREGDAYVTGDFTNAENRATVEIDGGVGPIVLKTLSE